MAHGRVAVVIPAYRAQSFISEAVRSLFAQTYADWEAWIIADDGFDYEALLGRERMTGPQLRFLSTGRVGSGAVNARNLALERIATPFAAVLDADDRMKPDKLARAVIALETHAIVSSALDVMDQQYRHLRHVGVGPDRLLSPGAYKFTCLSMDSMLVWDRRRCDARYDTTFSNMSDLEFLLQLWRTAPATWHLGAPAHDYIKVMTSMSNAGGVTEPMMAAKRTLLQRLAAGYYSFAAPDAVEGLAAFLETSLAAEADYPAALSACPGLLFADHLEPRLRAREDRPR